MHFVLPIYGWNVGVQMTEYELDPRMHIFWVVSQKGTSHTIFGFSLHITFNMDLTLFYKWESSTVHVGLV